MSEATKREAANRIRKAMALVESAQRHIDAAAVEIASVCGPGMGNEWTCLCKLYDTTKVHWHRLNNKLLCGKFDLDDMAAGKFVMPEQKVQVS